MSKKQETVAPVHRFSSAGDVHFKFVTITEASFEVPDIEHRHGYWTLIGKGGRVLERFATLDL